MLSKNSTHTLTHERISHHTVLDQITRTYSLCENKRTLFKGNKNVAPSKLPSKVFVASDVIFFYSFWITLSVKLSSFHFPKAFTFPCDTKKSWATDSNEMIKAIDWEKNVSNNNLRNSTHTMLLSMMNDDTKKNRQNFYSLLMLSIFIVFEFFANSQK